MRGLYEYCDFSGLAAGTGFRLSQSLACTQMKHIPIVYGIGIGGNNGKKVIYFDIIFIKI